MEDPARISGAVEELLRYDSPVQGLARVTTAPVTLHGVTIPEGGRVLLLFGSANRDERMLSDPDRFDVLRDPTRTSPSASAPTSAWARTWRAWRRAWPSKNCSRGSRTIG